jgi:uncharacterized membrane protein YhaH (DUF805 family)
VGVGKKFMEWFIKCLKHYADFSGRARRKEYWMFTLFNIIFSFAWGLVFGLIYALTVEGESTPEGFMGVIMSCVAIMLLPRLAVFVRRMHDLGKSGWWYFITLIPLVGAIWLFVLLVTEGNRGDNAYGPDPKATDEPYSERRRLKSVGITFIVGASITLLNLIVGIIFLRHQILFLEVLFMNAFLNLIILLAGIFLLQWKTIRRQTVLQSATLIMLLAVAAYGIVWNIIGTGHLIQFLSGDAEKLTQMGGRSAFVLKQIIGNAIWTCAYLSAAWLLVSLLLRSCNRMIRPAAIATTILFGITLLWSIYTQMQYKMVPDLNPLLAMQQLYLCAFNDIRTVAYIVFAATFLSKTTTAVVED